MIVMPRCQPLTDDEYLSEVAVDWARIVGDETDLEPPYSSALPVEMKSCSFGRLNGRIVAVDYGGCGRDGRTTKLVDKVDEGQ